MQVESPHAQASYANELEGTNVRAMSIATTLFFMWGFLTSLNDILIPNLKGIFDLNYTEVMLVQFAFFSSYFLFALPAGKIVELVGYKRTMIIGLSTMTVGALMFLPASRVPSFPLFLSALIVLAAGITGLQVAANPYVANLGPQRTASSRLNLAQALNSFGTFLAPIFGGLVILSKPAAVGSAPLTGAARAAQRVQEAATVQLPYIGIAATLAVLAIALALVKLPPMNFTQDLRPGEANPGTEDKLRNHPQLFLGALGIFLYVGAEVAIGSFLINYFQMPEIGGLSAKTASFCVSLYWGGAMLGRFAGAAILRFFSTGKVLAVAAAVAALLVMTSMLSYHMTAMVAIIAVGLFNSVMFPSIFTLGLEGLGPLTGRGSSLMVAAIVGGAIVPLLQGKLADGSLGLHHAFILPVLCYAYIAVFGFTRRPVALETA
ncbi:MFS transporter, FHS family, L-fucose permease [Granulicella rosea]|uniref:MFS transporter, FHS family, L-fucose permease n=1 Tax=Granulicella rosea TaxID=474952 RepID=A0A239KUU6_9BACT|nr:sugar MFS transporter [Granulicella rosea]SNT21269.1 MFS transporter, FHS family, L-fucose permease [Granulicella rosea]